MPLLLRHFILLILPFLVSVSSAHSSTDLVERAEHYDRALEQSQKRQAAREQQNWEDDFQRNGGRKAVGADEARALERAGVSAAGAYWQYPRGKNGQYTSGKVALILTNGMFCTYKQVEWSVNQITCREPNGAPVFVVYVGEDH